MVRPREGRVRLRVARKNASRGAARAGNGRRFRARGGVVPDQGRRSWHDRIKIDRVSEAIMNELLARGDAKIRAGFASLSEADQRAIARAGLKALDDQLTAYQLSASEELEYGIKFFRDGFRKLFRWRG